LSVVCAVLRQRECQRSFCIGAIDFRKAGTAGLADEAELAQLYGAVCLLIASEVNACCEERFVLFRVAGRISGQSR